MIGGLVRPNKQHSSNKCDPFSKYLHLQNDKTLCFFTLNCTNEEFKLHDFSTLKPFSQDKEQENGKTEGVITFLSHKITAEHPSSQKCYCGCHIITMSQV